MVQCSRRNNLAKVLSYLELAGCETFEGQADILGNIVTPVKLGRMLLGVPIPAFFARGVEHLLYLGRGWMDQPAAVLSMSEGATLERICVANARARSLQVPSQS